MILHGKDAEQALTYLSAAAEIAATSNCHRARTGAVVVRDSRIIGRGRNGPPDGLTLDRCLKDDLPVDFPSDRTCCVHAEYRAIFDTLRGGRSPRGADLFYLRLSDDDSWSPAGDPYCTMCSKAAMDAGIRRFALFQETGIRVWDAKKYHDASVKGAHQKRFVRMESQLSLDIE